MYRVGEYNKKENNTTHFLVQYNNLINTSERYFAELTDSLLTAQAFVFFAAGFETSSSAMSNALYELALNQEIQDKLRQEIREHLAKHNGELQYEHVKDMEYLEKVFKGMRSFTSNRRLKLYKEI